MADWRDYLAGKDPATHTVSGPLKVLPDVYSPQLDNRRDILVLLPPTYGTGDRHYPVIYMHDGQNLFDDAASYAGEWQVDETLMMLAAEGLEAIVVGVPNMGEDRVHELSPFAKPGETDGRGEAYVRFIVETVKPLVDADFHTLPGREHTGIAGSSMGGLISLYGFLRFGEVFGFAGVLSPALWFADYGMMHFVEQAALISGRLYVDVGTSEGGIGLYDPADGRYGHWELAQAESERYVADVNKLRDLLLELGYVEGDTLRYVVAPGDIHQESAWARRLPDALRYLLGRIG